MTGAEHYAEAERLLTAASDGSLGNAIVEAAARDGVGVVAGDAAVTAITTVVAVAQVHATLALADAQRMTWHTAATFVEATNGDYPPMLSVRVVNR